MNEISAMLALLLAAALPAPAVTPSPAPSPTAVPLKTIVTLVASPYCTALASHFNGAFVPMHGNDVTFDNVSVQLDDMNEMFKYPDYANRFLNLRTKIVKESDTLVKSLRPIQQQIDALRDAASLSNDPAAAQQMRDAAVQLEAAYQHQFQLSTDLTSLAQTMLQYDIQAGPHPLGGWTPQEQAMPADEKNIKVYLHFDKQRISIDDAENRAVDIAYGIAQTRCAR